jgi:hypothetical protein
MNEDKVVLSGAQLAGGNPTNERVEHDYYATNPVALEMLLEKEDFDFDHTLEPCIGGGHLADYILDSGNIPVVFDGYDIVDRGYSRESVNVHIEDFLSADISKRYTSIITNPPYSLAKEFVNKGMEVLKHKGKMAMFLKIQFLEGALREAMFRDYPPKYIYVFRTRMATWNQGEPLNPEGKRWATTMCHAWFIWEKGSNTEPIVRWL